MTEAWSATVGSSASTAVTRMTEVPEERESRGYCLVTAGHLTHSQMRTNGAQAVPLTHLPQVLVGRKGCFVF